MTDIKVSQRARKRAFNKALKKPSSAFTVVSRKKSQGTSQKKVSVTHQMIYPITLEKRHFIDLRICMADFAGMLILKNERRQVKILRIHVEWHWEGEVLKHFQNDRHWMHSFLLNQKNSPSMAAFWEKREDMKAFEEKKHEQQGVSGFHVAGRGLSAAEKKSFPWATIMQDSDGEILVPDVFLAPIQETSFVNLALRVLVANPLEMIDYERMMDLFSALMLNIYDFENDFMKKNKLDEAARVGPSAYRKLVQAAEEIKQEKIKCRLPETNESSCRSISTSSLTEVDEASGRGHAVSNCGPKRVAKLSGHSSGPKAATAPST